MSSNVSMYILIFVSFLTWLVFVITAIKIYRFFLEFEAFKAKNDAELNHLVWEGQKIEKEVSQLVVELQRSNRLLYDIYKGRDLSRKDTDNLEIDFKLEDSLRHGRDHVAGKDDSDEKSDLPHSSQDRTTGTHQLPKPHATVSRDKENIPHGKVFSPDDLGS